MISLYDQLSVTQSKSTINVFTATWNMGNAAQVGFSTILDEKDAFEKFDVIVLGLQESTYISDGNVAIDSINHLKCQLEDIMGNGFFVVQHCYRAQLQLYVFAKNELRNRITSVEQSIENTGFLGVFPNKGGLLVTFHLDGTKFAFISCHLAAHEGVKHCEARNASIIEILGGVRAGDKRYDVTEQFHHVFWMGDMNYRLTYDREAPKYTRKNVANAVTKVVEGDLEAVDEEEETESDFESEGDFDTDEEYVEEDEELGGVGQGEQEEEEEEEEIVHHKGSPKHSRGSKAKGAAGGGGGAAGEKKKVNKIVRKKQQKYRSRTMQMICEGRWTDLMKFDELNREINAGRVLNGFTALQPTFHPTFKRTRHLYISKGQELYAHDSDLGKAHLKAATLKKAAMGELVEKFYNAKRMPSFCDRVLYKSMPAFAKNIHVLFFESCEHAMSSDHKPVRAGFTVTVTQGLEGIKLKESIITGVKTPINGGAEGDSSRLQLPPLLRSATLGRGLGKQSSYRVNDFQDDPDLSIIEITFSNMKGHKLEDMDLEMFGGGSDPYMIITTDPPCLQLLKNPKYSRANPRRFYFNPTHEGQISNIIKHNCDPVWKDKITFYIPTTDLIGLAENASFVISVWDYDTYSADDLLGLLTIPFRDILKSHIKGTTHKFYRDVINNSEIMGKLSGTITIEGGVTALHKLFLAESKTEKMISLKSAIELYGSDGSNKMKVGITGTTQDYPLIIERKHTIHIIPNMMTHNSAILNYLLPNPTVFFNGIHTNVPEVY